MTFEPMSVEVTCVTLPKDRCVQVPREYINVCGYSDQFCKMTTYYILRTTYGMSDHIVSYWTQFRRDNYWTQFRQDKKKEKNRLMPRIGMMGWEIKYQYWVDFKKKRKKENHDLINAKDQHVGWDNQNIDLKPGSHKLTHANYRSISILPPPHVDGFLITHSKFL